MSLQYGDPVPNQIPKIIYLKPIFPTCDVCYGLVYLYDGQQQQIQIDAQYFDINNAVMSHGVHVTSGPRDASQ